MARLRLAILATLALTLAASPAAAQYTLGGMRLEGEIETGVRFFLEEPSKTRAAKFQEYRDVDDGLFLGRFYFRLSRPDEGYSAEIAGSNWGYEDQSFSLGARRLGLWEFGFEWDQMRHVLYTNTRLLATETDRGVWTLPSPRPSLPSHDAAPERELSVRWDTARIGTRITPTPNLDFRFEYSRIRKEGDMPMGMSMGSPGSNFYEVLQPIEQTIHDFRAQGVYAQDNWQLQFGYNLSLFENDERRIIADNPCRALGVANAGCGAGDSGATAPVRGQSSLPPSNQAHTFHLAGGYNLPWWRSRIHGNVSYSLRLQNESFLPHTINPSIDGDPDLRLPQKSLNGNVQIVNMNLVGTTHPLKDLGVTTKYRFYQQIDLSDQPIFTADVVSDKTISRETIRAHHFDFKRHNADIDVRLSYLDPVIITVGPAWERWDRNEGREVRESDEFFAKLALDATPWDWLQAKLTYRPSWRRIAHYNTFAHQEHVVVEDVAGELAGQSTFLRKPDEAERDRQRVDALLSFMPTEMVTITPTFGFKYDDYIDSALGLQNETSYSAGIDLSVTPSQWFSFAAGYVYERISQQQRQRTRTTTPTDFKDWEWISHNEDTVHTAYASVRGAVIPRLLDWAVAGHWSYALGRIDTNNPVDPQSHAGLSAFFGPKAKPMPAFEDQLFRVEASLKYHITKAWTATLGYAWESFEKHDWRTDALNPFVPVISTAGAVGQSSIWQGNDFKNYTAHLVGLTFTYRFGK
jgi:MtrB/PioB family decaheme-associated outer membrane protein